MISKYPTKSNNNNRTLLYTDQVPRAIIWVLWKVFVYLDLLSTIEHDRAKGNASIYFCFECNISPKPEMGTSWIAKQNFEFDYKNFERKKNLSL